MGQVLSIDGLAPALAEAKARNQTIVTTNGCFDLLHVGHLRYLQAAKAFGDVLVLALNSDASVKRLKGPKRPIVQQAERAELLAALNCIDYVVIFDEDTPARVLQAVRPDIHVKGGQYTEETLPEAPLLRSLNTQMRFIDMVEGRSTSEIIQRILMAESAV